MKKDSFCFLLKLTLNTYYWGESESKTWSYMHPVTRKSDCHLPAVTSCWATGVGQWGHSLHWGTAVALSLNWCWPKTGKKSYGAAVLVLMCFIIFYIFSFETNWALSSRLRCASYVSYCNYFYFNLTALKFFACVGNICQVCAGSFLRGLLL